MANNWLKPLQRYSQKHGERYLGSILLLLLSVFFYEHNFYTYFFIEVSCIVVTALWDLAYTKNLDNALANWTLVAMVAQGVNLGYAVFLVIWPPSDAVVGALWVSVIGYSALLIATAVLFIRLWNRTKDTGAYLEPAEDSPEH